jgi:hypothetical protein
MEKLCYWLMLLSFLAVVVLMAYTYVAGPQPWTRTAFAIAVIAWLGGAAYYFLGRRA